jgi:hypothetical protein
MTGVATNLLRDPTRKEDFVMYLQAKPVPAGTRTRSVG